MASQKVGEVLGTKLEIEWKIPNFFSLPEKVDTDLDSHTFAFRGGTWYIRLYPNGQTKHQSEGYISVFLMREDKGSPRTITYTLSLKSADGTLTELHKDTHTLPDGEYTGWGRPKALQRSELIRKKAKLAPSGCLTVICLLEVDPESVKVSEAVVEAATQTQSEQLHPEPIEASAEVVDAATQTPSESTIGKLSSDLNELLVSGEDSDLTIQVKGKEFRLHRGIMGARTPVFHSMLRHEMREKTTGQVSIDDCEVDTFEAFVHYVYSGRVDELCTETAFDLFVLTDKYQVSELNSACLDFIESTVSIDTFCDVVTLALTYDKRELLKQAVDFLADNMTEVLKTVKWMKFMKEHHIQANELLLKALEANKSKA